MRERTDPLDREAQLSTSFTVIILSLMTSIFLQTYLCIRVPVVLSFLFFLRTLLRLLPFRRYLIYRLLAAIWRTVCFMRIYLGVHTFIGHVVQMT